MSDRDLIRALGSVGRAFFGGFSSLRNVQRAALPRILAGQDVLVASATASGKTEAVLAPLVARTRDRLPADRIRLLLIAPTRALVNDLAERLDGPLGRLGLTCGRQTSDHRDVLGYRVATKKSTKRYAGTATTCRYVEYGAQER